MKPKVDAWEKASGRKLAASLADFLKSGDSGSVQAFLAFAEGGSPSALGHPFPDDAKLADWDKAGYQTQALTAFLGGAKGDPTALLLGAAFSGCPTLMAQFVIDPANVDNFVKDNGAALDEAVNAWAAQSQALDAFGKACAALPKNNLSAAAASVGAARPGNYFTLRSVAELAAKAEASGDISDKINAKVAAAEQGDRSWGQDLFDAVFYPARGGVDCDTLRQIAAGLNEDKAGVKDFLVENGATVDDKALEAAVAAATQVASTSEALSTALDKVTYSYDYGETN